MAKYLSVTNDEKNNVNYLSGKYIYIYIYIGKGFYPVMTDH